MGIILTAIVFAWGVQTAAITAACLVVGWFMRPITAEVLCALGGISFLLWLAQHAASTMWTLIFLAVIGVVLKAVSETRR